MSLSTAPDVIGDNVSVGTHYTSVHNINVGIHYYKSVIEDLVSRGCKCLSYGI